MVSLLTRAGHYVRDFWNPDDRLPCSCGELAVPTLRPLTFEYGGRAITVLDVPVYECSACGATLTSMLIDVRIDELLAKALADQRSSIRFTE